jgi:hypothetical protein
MLIDPSSCILLNVREDMILSLKAINLELGKEHGLDSYSNGRDGSEQLPEKIK